MRSPWRSIATASFLLWFAGPSLGQVTQRVSLASNGHQGSFDSTAVAITDDGRFVLFSSTDSNLVPGDTNGVSDAFVRDRRTGITERVSVDSTGAEANGYSGGNAITPDGRYVVFTSGASNLVHGDTNHAADVFVRDRWTGTTERVSVGLELQGNDESYGHTGCISADGRFVAFISFATNLVRDDTNGYADVFVHDRRTGNTERVNVSSTGEQAAPLFDDEYSCSISADGRYVAFLSDAANLVPGDSNYVPDVFVRDRLAGTTEIVSIASTGSQQHYDSGFEFLDSWMSADGRFVAFNSRASDLVPGDFNDEFDIFVHDRRTGITERVSVASDGREGNDESRYGSISADGRFVTFDSLATNLVPGDTNGAMDTFVRDRVAGTTERCSVGPDGVQALHEGWWTYSAASADGRFVVFDGSATKLAPDDTNGTRDVFVRERFGKPTFVSACEPGRDGVTPCPCSNDPRGDGRGCDNSSSTGGASLSATGGTFLSSDSLVFRVNGATTNGLGLLFQGTTALRSGAVYGQGVRCVGGSIRRLYTMSAESSSAFVPVFAARDAPISVRSSALGDVIRSGEQRLYQVVYRDPIVLGGCPASSTFNATQAGVVTWSP